MYEREVVIIRSANVETLGESVFPARNAIDGVTENMVTVQGLTHLGELIKILMQKCELILKEK